MWGKMFSIFLFSILFPKVSYFLIPTLKFNIFQTLFSIGLAGVFGSFLFTYIFDGAIKAYDRWKEKNFPSKKKRIFHWRSRFIIKAKRNFGIIGIAALAPWISIPLASFLCLRFFGNRRRVFLSLSISCLLWATLMFYLLLPLHNVSKGTAVH